MQLSSSFLSDFTRLRPQTSSTIHGAHRPLAAYYAESVFDSATQADPVIKRPNSDNFKSSLFDHLSTLEIKEFCERAHLKNLVTEQRLFSEGDEADGFYIVAEGTLRLETTSGVQVEFKEGDFFGELALLGDMKRTGTVTATENSTLLHFTKEQLVESFVKYPGLEAKLLSFFYRRLFLAMTSRITAFDGFSDSEMIDFYCLFKPLSVRKQLLLFKPGQPSSHFYFIIFGCVEVTFDDGSSIEIEASNFVGEMGYLGEESRNALVRTKTDCHLLRCEHYMGESIKRDFPKIFQMMQKISEVRGHQNRNRARAP